MGKKDILYKSVKVLPETHFILTDYSKLSGKSMVEVLEKLTYFVSKNKIGFAQLSSSDFYNSSQNETKESIERVISIVRKIESDLLIPLHRGNVRIESNVDKILSNMQMNISNEKVENEVKSLPSEAPADPTKINYTDNSNYNELKIEKERVELRLDESVKALKNIFNKIGQTSQGYRRTFDEDEYNYLKRLIERCTPQ